MPIRFKGLRQNIPRELPEKGFCVVPNFFFLFCSQCATPTHDFHETKQNTLWWRRLQLTNIFFCCCSCWTDKEQCLSLGTLTWKLLEFKGVQYWEAFTKVIQLLGKLNLKQLEWWMWVPSVFLWGGEGTEGAFRRSWGKLLGGQQSRACLLSNSVCQLQQHSCFLLRTDSACSVHACEERHFQTLRYNGAFTHLKPS